MTEGPLPQPTRSIPAPRPRRRARPAVREAGFVVADDLPPALRRRVRSLLKNLSADDPSTAFLDFASLYRSVAETTVETPVAGATESAPRPPALIFGEDAQTVAEVCNGPDQFGMCPRAHSAGHAACAGRWLMASAWTFKVAPNAVLCPLVPLGLAPGPRLFALGPGLEPDPKTHTGPIPRAS